jgi:hypothetical protein
MVGIQQGGQVLTNGANRAGRAGTVIGTGTSTGSNSASQGVYNKILYDKSKTDIATMKYLLCYRGSCTDEATIVFRIQEDSNSTTRQSRWLLLAYGPAKDKMQPLVGGPADLYEGSGGFTRPDLLQEQLVDLLLLEAKSNRFKLVGASQLAGLLRDVKTAVDRRFGSVVASASIPAVVDSTDVEAERRPAAAAKLGQGEMVPMHREAPQPQAERPRQILDQPPCNPKDAKWDKVKGAFVCPQSAATQSTPPTPRPTPATQFVLQAPPTDGQVGIVAGPFVRAISFLPGASKMKGHDVDLLLALLVNKKYLTWDPTWGRVWGENATAAWQRMEERFKTQGAPLVADGKLTADEFAYWNKVYATYADDFASPEVWQQTPKPAATRRP